MTLRQFQMSADNCFRLNCKSCDEGKKCGGYRFCKMFKYKQIRRSRDINENDLLEYLLDTESQEEQIYNSIQGYKRP